MSEITESDIIRAKRLREEGATWKLIGKTLGHDKAALRARLDPRYRVARNEKIKGNRVSRGYVNSKRAQPEEPGGWFRHLARLTQERDQRLSVPPTLDNLLNGTPVKGRSAADGWQQQGVSELPRNGRPPNDARPKPWRPLLKGEAHEAAE